MKLIASVCLIVGLAGGTALGGETAPGPVPAFTNLTLETAVEIALDRHPELAEFRARVDAAAARAQGAGRFPNPEAVARMESAPIASGTLSGAEYVAGVSQALPLGGRLAALRAAEKAAVDVREKELAVAALQVARSVHGAYATALFTSEVLQVQTNLAAALQELLRITTARVELGDAAPLDLARLESEEARQRLAVRESSALHQEALHDLAAALGDFRIPIRSLAGSLEDALQLEQLREEGFAVPRHPAVVASESAVAAQEARVRLAEAGRIPDVNLDLFYRRIQPTREDAFDIGIRMPIPLFDRQRSRVREAESELRAAEARRERTRNEIRHQRHASELALRKAVDSVELLRAEVLPKTELSLRGAEARYTVGDISLGELLLVRRDAAENRMQYLQALRDVMEAWAGLSGFSLPEP